MHDLKQHRRSASPRNLVEEGRKVQTQRTNFFSSRQPDGYGGVGILIADELVAEDVELPEFDVSEVVGVRIKRGFQQLNLFTAYLPPTRGPSSAARKEMASFFLFPQISGWRVGVRSGF